MWEKPKSDRFFYSSIYGLITCVQLIEDPKFFKKYSLTDFEHLQYGDLGQ